MLNWSELPLWATIAKRVITLLIFAAFGLHAYVQYRIGGGKIPVPQRWIFLAFSVMLLFGAIANFVALIIAARLEIRQGPVSYGSFSLLIFTLYIIFAFGFARRTRY